MKNIAFAFATFVLATGGAIAQEVSGEKQETVTKKVVTKGTTVETKVVAEVKQEKEVMKIEEDGSVNQSAKKEVAVKTDEHVVVENSEKNKEAEAAIAKMKAERQAEIQKSRDELLERARKEGLLLERGDEAQRMKQLEEQKKKYAERKKKAAKKKKTAKKKKSDN